MGARRSGFKEQTVPSPKPTSFRMDPNLKAALETAAAEDGRSISQMLDRILRAWLIERGYLPKR